MLAPGRATRSPSASVAWPAEVDAGRDPQLDEAIELALAALEPDPPPTRERPPFPVRTR